jgi:anti-sigma factor RsiW
MNCEQAEGLLADRLTGHGSAADAQRLDAHLATCAACRDEAAASTALWTQLGEPDSAVPHERMRARFHAALATYEAREARHWTERVLERWWPQQPALQVGLAAALALVGVLVGQQLPSPADAEIAALRHEVRLVGVALLDHQSASERLLGVEWSRRTVQTPDVVNALLERVQHDSNLNVQLAAVDALRLQLDRQDVSAGLAVALQRQDAPLLQIALTDALLANGSSAAVDAVRGVLTSTTLDPSVRDYVQMALTEVDADATPSTDI